VPSPPPPVPLYRPEAPLYSKIPLLARQMDLLLLGTFHERQGDQYLLDDDHSTWGRLIGVGLEQGFTGPLAPSYNGTIGAIQLGTDLALTDDHANRAGLFFTYAHANGTVRGTILDIPNQIAGTLPMDAVTLGGTFTHFGDNGWYADAVLMGSWFTAHPLSVRGIGTDVNGSGITASLEGGYPFRIDPEFTLEPMTQIVFSSLAFDPASDPFTTLNFQPSNAWFGRIGVRLEDNTLLEDVHMKPFLETNLWHSFGGTDVTMYNGTIPVSVPFGNTDMQFATGITSQAGDDVSLYARVSYTFDISGNYQKAVEGDVGIRYSW
jgi:autotransporter family porin